MRISLPRSVALDAFAHLFECGRAVLGTECLPGSLGVNQGCVRKEAPSHDEVVGRVQFEEQRLADGQQLKKTPSTRLPEVDLIQVRPGAEEVVPVVVGNRHVCSHTHLLSSTTDSG